MRPVLVGANNPYSARPDRALWPDPPGCTGWRTWTAVVEYGGIMSKTQFLRGFDRINVLNDVVWSAERARACGPEVWRKLRGRTVAILGIDAMRALGIRALPLFDWLEIDDALVCLVPHPSGRNLQYNDHALRAALGARLWSMYSSGVGCGHGNT